jgi:hypothetical protein
MNRFYEAIALFFGSIALGLAQAVVLAAVILIPLAAFVLFVMVGGMKLFTLF